MDELRASSFYNISVRFVQPPEPPLPSRHKYLNSEFNQAKSTFSDSNNITKQIKNGTQIINKPSEEIRFLLCSCLACVRFRRRRQFV